MHLEKVYRGLLSIADFFFHHHMEEDKACQSLYKQPHLLNLITSSRWQKLLASQARANS